MTADAGADSDVGVVDAAQDDLGLEDLDFDTDPEPAPDADGPAPSVVVFDIGEVLVDETRVWTCWANILGVSPLTFAAVLGAAIVQGEDHRAVFPHVAPNCDWEEFLDEHERRYQGFTRDDLYPDAVPCLRELTDIGFRIGIAGNQPARRREQLAALDLPHDMLATSEGLEVHKPDPAFFETVVAMMDASRPEEVLYVGDRVDHDVLPAREVGLRTCWLRRGPWGQLQELPEGVLADIALEGLGELPLLLQHWRQQD